MARYRGAVCRLCRREQVKLYLKGERCYSKCTLDKRNFYPGQHGAGARRGKLSEYGIQLREKQKVKRLYGLLENQFRLTFKKAERQSGKAGENLLLLLEKRLDNVVYKLGFASSLAQSRQLVKHSHILVNGRKSNIPSMQVSVEDVITIREKSKTIDFIKESLEATLRKGLVPSWLSIDSASLSGKVVSEPVRENITVDIHEQLIVEHYSR